MTGLNQLHDDRLRPMVGRTQTANPALPAPGWCRWSFGGSAG